MQTNPNLSDKPTFEKVWLMFQETDKKFQETDRQFKETDRQIKETDLKLKESDKKFQESMDDFKKEMKKLWKTMSQSENRWGKFVEALASGSLVKLLKGIGIQVNEIAERERRLYNGKQYEIDVIARNGVDIVAVEVKTTLSTTDVKDFIEVLKVFKHVFQRYSSNRVLGAVAYISLEGKADVFAEKKGLLVIKAIGEGAKIVNTKGFVPKEW
jgi:hypothetical protein